MNRTQLPREEPGKTNDEIDLQSNKEGAINFARRVSADTSSQSVAPPSQSTTSTTMIATSGSKQLSNSDVGKNNRLPSPSRTKEPANSAFDPPAIALSSSQDDSTTDYSVSINNNKDSPSSSGDPLAAKKPPVPMTPLPDSFVPGPFDVWCGRGRACKNAPGNIAYRQTVLDKLSVYAAACTKLEKGVIITNIVQSIQEQCYSYHGSKVGGFVKQQQTNGGGGTKWFQVGDFLAREKTSQCFRDALSAQYSSSAQSKYQRRRAQRENGDEEQQGVVVVVQQPPRDVVVAAAPTTATLAPHLQQQQQPLDAPQASNNNKRKRRQDEESVADILGNLAAVGKPPALLASSSSSDTSPPISSSSQSSSSVSMATRKMATGPSLPSTVSQMQPARMAASGPSLQPMVSHQMQPVAAPHIAPANSVMYHHQHQPMPPYHCAPAMQSQHPPRGPSRDSTSRVCAVQAELRPPSESPLDALVRIQHQIETVCGRDSAVDLFVLPELSPVGYSEDTFAKYLPINRQNQNLYLEFDHVFQALARKLRVYICYGTIGWTETGHGGPPKLSIRQVVVDRAGRQVAYYDKTYLCDYGVCAETRFFSPGPASHPVSFDVENRDGSGSFRFGLVICADMRFPVLSRRLAAEHRVDCILQPAAFSRDCTFRTWSSFRETRAVENSVYWIAVNYGGTNFGESALVSPWVDEEQEPAKLGCETGVLVGSVSRRTLDHVRSTMPFYRNLFFDQSSSKPAYG